MRFPFRLSVWIRKATIQVNKCQPSSLNPTPPPPRPTESAFNCSVTKQRRGTTLSNHAKTYVVLNQDRNKRGKHFFNGHFPLNIFFRNFCMHGLDVRIRTKKLNLSGRTKRFKITTENCTMWTDDQPNDENYQDCVEIAKGFLFFFFCFKRNRKHTSEFHGHHLNTAYTTILSLKRFASCYRPPSPDLAHNSLLRNIIF